MTCSPTQRATPVSPAFLRSFAPVLSDPHASDEPVSALSLFGFSDSEREVCLDAVDLCGLRGEYQAVEIYLYGYEEFVRPRDLVENGLTLLRIPDRLNEDDLTWLTVCMSTLAERPHVCVVPVLPSASMAAPSTVLHEIAPYSHAFLNCDSDVRDYATVISAFLHLPRWPPPVYSACANCETRTVLNGAPTPFRAWPVDQPRHNSDPMPPSPVTTPRAMPFIHAYFA